MADNNEVVFPTTTQTPEALKVLDEYDKNATTALQKLSEAIEKVEAQLKNLQDTRLVVNGQRELVLDMKKRLLASTADTAPAVKSEPATA
ncbi:MAG: hypothetical protein EBU46_16555 [Nitrosomonadaceae bacterium]|nr:hypothetical protein [Nitrosomonadaceae bacterium]